MSEKFFWQSLFSIRLLTYVVLKYNENCTWSKCKCNDFSKILISGIFQTSCDRQLLNVSAKALFRQLKFSRKYTRAKAGVISILFPDNFEQVLSQQD